MRTFRCRGGLANDSSSQKRLILKCDRRSSTQKSSHCRSPVLAPVRFAMFVGRATFSLTHRPVQFQSLSVLSVVVS